jgi:2-polyprenyl-3-methyl-5-hydroxy-6-metoxy-1,4-benzoquinol methylase
MTDFNPKAYWEDRLRSNAGLKGVGFTTLGQRYNEWLYRVRRRVFRRVISRLQVTWTSARVLDIGTGTGFYIERWKELGVSYIAGSDMTECAVSRLRIMYPGCDVHQMDIGEKDALHNLGKYDVISAFDVLFHVVDDQRFENAIKNIHSALSDRGWFVFSDVLLHAGTKRHVHFVGRSLEAVENTLRRTGFDIVDRRPVFVLMNAQLDTTGKVRELLWRFITFPATKSETCGYITGALLYPVELLLTALLQESPSTELLVCRKATEASGTIA